MGVGVDNFSKFEKNILIFLDWANFFHLYIISNSEKNEKITMWGDTL
jgi:hypothetical protein